MIPYLRAANVKDGSLDLSDVKSMDFDPLEQSTYALRVGDVLVTEGSGSLSSVGASAVWSGEIEGVVCFQNTLLRLRPRGDTEARYLMWWARHAYGSGLLASVAEGANIYHLGADNVRSLPASIPDPGVQRAIADYLDAETAGIDQIVDRLVDANVLLDEWLAAEIEATIWSAGDPLVPLMHLTPGDRQIQYGIVLPGPDVLDGVPIVKGGNIVTGRLRSDGLARTTYEIESGYTRSRLRRNDIVFAIRGAVGACALVPERVEGANITQDVARVSPLPEVDPSWFLYALRSRSLQQQVASRIVGATIRGVNIRDLKRVRVPVPTPVAQARRAEGLGQAQAHRDQVFARRQRQIELLLERRQALITAAVTGQLDIPGVAAWSEPERA